MTIKRRYLEPTDGDYQIRALARRHLPSNSAKLLAPLFPLGMPGGYVTIAYATAHWLHRGHRRGGPAIVTAAWAGWLAQRVGKELFVRERPRRPRVGRRLESFPSGHTTGTTATALTAALVLRRQGVLSNRMAALLGVGAPLVMGVYRVIDDEHWATDVVAGWILGGAVSLACVAALGHARGRGHAVRELALSRRGRGPRGRPAQSRSAG